MKTKTDIVILPEDRVVLNQDQQNLITLALEKQLPIEDAQFLEGVQTEAIPTSHPYGKVESYFTTKYGKEFGKLYLATITGGEKGYKEFIVSLERARAVKRTKMETTN